MIVRFYKRWRNDRAQAAAKRAELQRAFEVFLRETEPFMPPGSKHPRAALYRHAWKRAAVLGFIYQHPSDQNLDAQFKDFEKLAGERYFEAASETLYGKAPLQMGEKVMTRLLEFEMQRLFPAEGNRARARRLACIYIGKCEKGRVYIGQTVVDPERFSIVSDGQDLLRKKHNTSNGAHLRGLWTQPSSMNESLTTLAFSMLTKRDTMKQKETIGRLTNAAKWTALRG